MVYYYQGSTYKRKANKSEKSKSSPTFKDLDFLQMYPNGITLDHETYDAVVKTISRDVRVRLQNSKWCYFVRYIDP